MLAVWACVCVFVDGWLEKLWWLWGREGVGICYVLLSQLPPPHGRVNSLDYLHWTWFLADVITTGGIQGIVNGWRFGCHVHS